MTKNRLVLLLPLFMFGLFLLCRAEEEGRAAAAAQQTDMPEDAVSETPPGPRYSVEEIAERRRLSMVEGSGGSLKFNPLGPVLKLLNIPEKISFAGYINGIFPGLIDVKDGASVPDIRQVRRRPPAGIDTERLKMDYTFNEDGSVERSVDPLTGDITYGNRK